MLKIFIVLSLGATIAGCASPSERAALAQKEAAERAALIQNTDDQECRSYGAQPGTQPYFQCRMMKDQQRQANKAAIASALIMSRPAPAPMIMQRAY